MQKFRPYLTAQELLEILKALKSSPSAPTNMALIRYLETYAVKIDRGIIEPSLTLAPTLEARLDGSLPKTKEPIESLISKYSSSPESCSHAELEKIQLFRYTNDLMSPEEEASYEQSQGVS